MEEIRLKFLYVKDENIKDKLLDNKFTMLQCKEQNGKYYVFANNGVLTFSENDKKEILFSNEIHL